MPVALAGLFTRVWEWAILTGSATFVIFLFLDRWASYSYWLAVLPVSGVAVESLLRQHFQSDLATGASTGGASCLRGTRIG